jgi:regulatory protein YycI of two-component signal transduction system YycFG
MSKSKKIFIVVASIFLIAMIYLGYDISSRTTFPGSKPQLKERLLEDHAKKDSINIDTILVD